MPALWFTAGLAAFVLGIRNLTGGLERLGGRALRRSLGRFGRDPAAAWLGGAVAAALLHSSGLVTVAVVGLVQAGAIGFPAAIGALLGANVGTTATAQLMSFSTLRLGWAGTAGGALLLLAGRARRAPREHWSLAVGEALFGTGLIFLGLEAVGSGMASGAAGPLGRRLSELAGRPVAGILAGAVFTSLIQSSTIFIGVVMQLAGEGLLTLTGAIYLVLGSNVGSCVPGVVAGLVSGKAGCWAGLVNLLFNAAGVAAAAPLAPAMAVVVASTAASFPRQVANAHGLFNLVTALAALPLAGPVGRWLEKGMDSAAANPGGCSRGAPPRERRG